MCGSSLGRWARGVGRTTMDAPLSSSSLSSEGRRQLFLFVDSSAFMALPLSFGNMGSKITFPAMLCSEVDPLPWSVSIGQTGLLHYLPSKTTWRQRCCPAEFFLYIYPIISCTGSGERPKRRLRCGLVHVQVLTSRLVSAADTKLLHGLHILGLALQEGVGLGPSY